MYEIALYNLLKQIPNATDEQVEKAVESVASTKDVVTKLDIADLETRLVERMERMARLLIMWMVALFLGQAVFMFNVLKVFMSG